MSEVSSKERMIEAALTLLARSGLSGAGINAVIERSGAPKGSVYHHFPGGKQDLVAAALRQFDLAFRSYLDHLWCKPGTAADKVQQFVAGMARRLQQADYREGCPVGAVILDLEPEDEGLRELCRVVLGGWIDSIATRLDHVPADQRRAFAGFIVTALEGGLILSRTERDTRSLLEAGAMIALQLRSLERVQPAVSKTARRQRQGASR